MEVKRCRLPTMPLFLPFLLPLFLLSRGYQGAGSGCQDLQDDMAELCLEDDGSGSGLGSGDFDSLDPAISRESTLRSVCRSSGLGAWRPGRLNVEGTMYRMIQHCPREEEHYSQSLAARCELQDQGESMDHISLLLPVTSASTNLTYYNRHCLLCSEDPGPVETWQVNVSCVEWLDLQSLESEQDVLRAAWNSKHCAVELRPPPDVPTEQCLHDAALNLPARVFHGAGAPLSVLLRFRTPWAGGGLEEEGDGRRGEGGGLRDDCHGFIVRSFGEERCLALNCAPGKRLKGNTCHPVIGRSRGQHYTLTLFLHLLVRHTADVTGDVALKSVWSPCSLEELVKAGVTQKASELHSKAYNLTGWILSADEQAVLTSLDVPHDSVDDLYFDDSAGLSTDPSESLNNVTAEAREFQLGRVLIWFDFFVTTNTDRNDVEQLALRMTEDEWHVVCGDTYARLVPNRENRENYVMNNLMNQRNKSDRFPIVFRKSVTHTGYQELLEKQNFVSMTVAPFLVCPFVNFGPHEYSIDQLSAFEEETKPVTSLTLLNSTQTVRLSDIEVDKYGNLKICSHLFEEKYGEVLLHTTKSPPHTSGSLEKSLWVLVEQYLSLMCVSLSLVCLTATIVTYSLFRSLRSVPGQNTLALCCNLFVAQALLQFGVSWPELREGCIVLGMLVHYFWLTSVLWMNVSSFHMYRVFTCSRATSTSSGRVRCCTRTVLAYGVFAQGVPLVMIGATVSTVIFLSEGRQIGYGGRLCYLSSSLLVGATFAAPLGIVVLVNLFFFLRAVQAITKTEVPMEVGAAVQNGHRSDSPCLRAAATPFPSPWRRNLNVGIRLSSLTGLFWALGLIAELLDQRVLRMVSVVVNGSQGVLIAASYLPTRRVRRLYSQLCCTCRADRPRSTSLAMPGSSPAGTMPVTMSSSLPGAPRDGLRDQHSSDV